MECAFFGVVGGLIAYGCVYLYNRATRKRISSKEVVDTVIESTKRNNGAMRDIIREVRNA